jgi:hypothetical protein
MLFDLFKGEGFPAIGKALAHCCRRKLSHFNDVKAENVPVEKEEQQAH